MQKKHPCPDCHCCLECSDARCRLCRQPVCERMDRKLSFAEQIRLYEEYQSRAVASVLADSSGRQE